MNKRETEVRVRNCFLLSKTKQLSKLLKLDSNDGDFDKYEEARRRLISWTIGNVSGADELSSEDIEKALDSALDAFAEGIGEA